MGYLTIFFFAFVVSLIVFIYQLLIRSKVHIVVKAIFAVVLTFSIMLGAYIGEMGLPSGSTEEKILSPIAVPITKGIETVRHAIRSKELEQIILEETEGKQGEYAVAIKNLKTNEEFFLNENQKFGSASLYKLWVMGETFRQIESGKISMDTRLSDSVENLNRRFGLASESAELKEGSVTRTVKTALEDMITISANYPAYLLSSKLGSSNIKDFITDNRFTNSALGTLNSEPSTTPLDIFKFYEKLYKRELVSKSASNEMLEILKRQTLNDRIPKYLPKNIVVAHKTGELFGFKHNAGIVFSPKGDYIIVLFSNTRNHTTAAEVEAQISKRVFEYFNK